MKQKHVIKVPVVAEIKVLWRAIDQFSTQEFGFTNHVVFEWDTKGFIEEIKNAEEICSWYEQMLEDIRLMIRGNSHWSIQYTPRERRKSSCSYAG